MKRNTRLEAVRVSDFHFDLPEELIAQHPPAERGSSRMLVLDRRTGALTDEMFRSLPRLLQSGDLLILNDSRVLPARLFAARGGLTTQANSPQPSGVIEVLLTERIEDSTRPGENLWRVLVKPARKVRVGEMLHFFGAAGEADLAPGTEGLGLKSVLKKSDSAVRSEGPGLKPPDSMSFTRGVETPRSLRKANSGVFQNRLKPVDCKGAIRGAEAPRSLRKADSGLVRYPQKPADSRDFISGAETPSSRRKADSAVFQHPVGPSSLRRGNFEIQSSTIFPQPVLSAEVVAAGEFGERTLRFEPVEDFYERVGRIGHMPLPPYIRRDQSAEPDSAEDRERYQTVYSDRPGSAAAPTAGLHFTPEVLAALDARGVEIRYITLHVGLGTFQPVRVERLEEIRLHAERYTLPAETAEALNRALDEGRRIVAVGTTTTRTLEHIGAQRDGVHRQQIPGAKARMGVVAGEPGLKSLPVTEQIEAQSGPIEPHSGSTSIFLGPGHKFRIVSGLLTNFHLPESTLLMLVSAFVARRGEPDQGRQTVLAAYAHAVRSGYRFYSYGDCMLVL